MGEYGTPFPKLYWRFNQKIYETTNDYYDAKKVLENYRNIKNILVERARILKTIIQAA